VIKKIPFVFKAKTVFRIVFFAISFLIVPEIGYVNAQSSAVSSQQKKADKKKAEQRKKAEKAKLKGVERQRKIQTKETRKRMKKHRKQTTTPYKKPNFFQRLFGKKK
jgi:Skp family chaperone for outer membrane proteins